jgi:hypothetical protein
MSLQRFVLALGLSFCITLGLAAVYIFAPLVLLFAKSASGGAETGGIAAVSGDINKWTFLIAESVVLASLLFILSRRRTV